MKAGSSKAAGALLAGAVIYKILKLISEGGTIDNTHYEKVRYLKRHGYIDRQDESYSLTSKGKAELSERHIWNLQIPKPTSWDHKWRLVMFDIPVDRRKRRDVFRLRLKEMGLVLYQNSVWVYPYPLENEITQVARFYNLERCVSFASAERISGEAHLKKQFGLS